MSILSESEDWWAENGEDVDIMHSLEELIGRLEYKQKTLLAGQEDEKGSLEEGLLFLNEKRLEIAGNQKMTPTIDEVLLKGKLPAGNVCLFELDPSPLIPVDQKVIVLDDSERASRLQGLLGLPGLEFGVRHIRTNSPT